ncbi:M23 family metallopeptidase [Chamaesiphon sp. VAR_69_metabat_338]|uniref:M23 family metallopeptidase n=1 Tax=Chamaesiphon sp. VAR_69_metabat_338 TaxID=2964704 RepID=UPI00286E905D|nr:M23 family metallopeptidase [Chamaesiphon sp. VAR_69_metabat_338]
MRTNKSLRFLVIAGAFLSAEAALAQNSHSNVQDLVANNTLKPQLLGAERVASPDAVDLKSLVTEKDPNKAAGNKTFGEERHQPVTTLALATKAISPTEQRTSPFGYDDDRSSPASQALASRNEIASPTQGAVFASDVNNLKSNVKISGVPTAAITEPNVEIFVPQPRTQLIKVQPVTRLPRVIKTSVIPSVTAIPTLRPTGSKMPFSQPNQPPVSIPTTPVPPVASINSNGTTGATHAELIYPLMNPAPMTSRFGWRTHPLTGTRRFHSGVDIGAPSGTPVIATATGTIISAGWNGGYGKAVVIQHGDTQQTLYGHLSEISVQAGQTVPQGTVIGLVGSTGNSTGPHLHFETRSPGATGWVAVDPTPEVQYAIDNLRRSMPYARQDSPQGL